jgi:hypothetical protein
VSALTYVFYSKAPGSRKKPRLRKSSKRNWRYRAWVRTLPSAVSGFRGCEAAHTGTDGGTATKSSDYSCIPLTPAEHLEYHRIGRSHFENCTGIDCAQVVKRLNDVWSRFSTARGKGEVR